MLIKIMLSIDYVFYFMLIDEKGKRRNDIYFDKIYEKNNQRIANLLEKGEIDIKVKNDLYHKTICDIKKQKENRLLRFDNDNYCGNAKSNCYYVINHLIILF